MSRFLISCGGTGGHVSPGISLAEGLVSRGHEVTLLISMKKVDSRLVEKYPHLRFERMPGSGFSWHPVGMARFAYQQAAAFRYCLAALRTMKADAVVGFGGFTSAPAAAAGRALGVPIALHEANRVPGLALRVFGRFAQRVYVPQGIRVQGVRAAATRHAGLPVRREIVRMAAAQARESLLALDPAQKVLGILGGSQGASSLNEWARSRMGTLANEGIQLVCVTGLGKGAAETVVLKSKKGERRSRLGVHSVLRPGGRAAFGR